MKIIIEQLLEDFFERGVPEVSERDLNPKRMAGKACVVIGMRRVGKTYLCYQIMTNLLDKGCDPTSLLYINFEDDRLLGFSVQDFQILLDVYFAKFPEHKNRTCTFFLDEIQNVEGWEAFVRRVLDTENIELVLTGSSAKLLSKEIATSLRGRSLSMELFPLSFSEALCYNGIFKSTPSTFGSANSAKLRHEMLKYLKQGGFPEVQACDEVQRVEVLQSYLDSVILRDVMERHRVSNTIVLKRLTNALLSTPGGQFSVNKFYNTLRSMGIKCTKNSLYEYLDHLEDAYLIQRVPMMTWSERVRAVNPSKVYPMDTGLARACSFQHSQNLGPLLETIVYLQLRRKSSCIEYFQAAGGQEVDFVVWDLMENVQQLVQASWDMSDAKTRERELEGLKIAMAELQITEGLIVSYDEEDEVETSHGLIRVVPVWKWLCQRC